MTISSDSDLNMILEKDSKILKSEKSVLVAVNPVEGIYNLTIKADKNGISTIFIMRLKKGEDSINSVYQIRLKKDTRQQYKLTYSTSPSEIFHLQPL